MYPRYEIEELNLDRAKCFVFTIIFRQIFVFWSSFKNQTFSVGLLSIEISRPVHPIDCIFLFCYRIQSRYFCHTIFPQVSWRDITFSVSDFLRVTPFSEYFCEPFYFFVLLYLGRHPHTLWQNIYHLWFGSPEFQEVIFQKQLISQSPLGFRRR